jgi:hypothetical protein
VTWEFRHSAGVEARVVHHALSFGVAPINAGDLDNLRLAVDAALTAEPIAGYLASDWTLETVRCVAEDVIPGLENFSTYGIVGTRFGDSLPTQVACIVRGSAPDVPGRRGRMRNFWPFFTENDLVDGLFTAAAAAAAAYFVTELASNIDANSLQWTMAVASHTYGVAGSVSGFTADVVPDIQRRRRPPS